MKTLFQNKSKIKIALHLLLGLGSALAFLGYAERHTLIQLMLSTFAVVILEVMFVEFFLQKIIFKAEARLEDGIITGLGGIPAFIYYVATYGFIWNGDETFDKIRAGEFYTGLILIAVSTALWFLVEFRKKK